MRLVDARRRLPIVDSLPTPRRTRTLGEDWSPRDPTPRLAVWEITLACDQACIHCGSRAGAARPDELDTDECLDLVAQLAEIGVGEVVLVGGESYLRNDFVLIVRAIHDAGMTCTITTGGRTLTRTRAEAMVEAGVSAVNVSIDGLEAAHDRLRGTPGSWRAAFRALAHLRAAGAKVSVNTQINRLTRHDLVPLLHRLADAGVRAWQLQLTAPFGNAGDHPEILLQPYMLPALFEELERVADAADARGVMLWPANNLGYFGPLEARLRRHQKRGAHYKGCGAGRYALGIEANGAIKGCPSLGGTANVGGTVREHSLRQIWHHAQELRYTRERTAHELWGFCRTCYYADVCRAGCTATAEPLLGRPGNNPLCLHRAQTLAQQGLRERIELVQRGPGQPFDHGLYRVITEPLDPAERAARGPTHVEEPRTSRLVDPMGPGRPLSPSTRAPSAERLRSGRPIEASAISPKPATPAHHEPWP
ncbi:MAG: radical SAM protein [Myxococcales bacterium]|nr:radical SAM protein [Myxococcales bacterium]